MNQTALLLLNLFRLRRTLQGSIRCSALCGQRILFAQIYQAKNKISRIIIPQLEQAA